MHRMEDGVTGWGPRTTRCPQIRRSRLTIVKIAGVAITTRSEVSYRGCR